MHLKSLGTKIYQLIGKIQLKHFAVSFIYCFQIESPSYRSSHQRCSLKKVSLKISQNSQENTCARVSSLIKLQAIKGTLAQVFSCEFYDVFKSTFFIEHFYSFRDMVAQREDGFSNTELYGQFYYFGLLNYLLLFNFICCQ